MEYYYIIIIIVSFVIGLKCKCKSRFCACEIELERTEQNDCSILREVKIIRKTQSIIPELPTS